MSAIFRRSLTAAKPFHAFARPTVQKNLTIAGLRYLSFKAEDQPRIRIGSVAPNFKAVTTEGDIDFHEWIGDSWAVLFSHPADFTPVCTTELGAFSKLAGEFSKRNAKLIGLSADPLPDHFEWVKDIEDVTGGSPFAFPIIADESREVSFLYDMVDQAGFDKLKSGSKDLPFTIRNVFIIDPSKKVRLFIVYPASTGRNSAEVLRVLDALQTSDRTGLVTPVDWVPGTEGIVPPSIPTADAEKKYGELKVLKSYLRFAKIPESK